MTYLTFGKKVRYEGTVKDLIEFLQSLNPKARVVVATDEELNSVCKKFDVTYLENKDNVVIFPLSGSEIEE